MTDGVGADHAGDLDLALGDQGAGNRGAQQILAFIEGIGAEHGEDEVPDEFLAQVVDEDVLGLDAHAERLFARGLQLLALTQVGGEGHHLGAVLRLEPFQDDGGVEPAGIGKDNLFGLEIGHGGYLGDGARGGARNDGRA